MGPFFTTNDAGKLRVSSNFGIYWAVIVPLTVVVFLIWFAYLYVSNTRRQQEAGHSKEKTPRHTLKPGRSPHLRYKNPIMSEVR